MEAEDDGADVAVADDVASALSNSDARERGQEDGVTGW